MLRIGHGYDVHRFAENRSLILGGVNIDYPLGLLGHSDADVLLHAISDSLLGAAALGDIGKLFPDTDSTTEGISSLHILQRVCECLEENGYSVVNVDATIIAQAPKLAPFTDEMRENISRSLGCDVSQVSVKATTEEGLGFSGRKEGIAAHAVCLITRS